MCYQNVVGSINLLDAGRRLIGIRFEVVRRGFETTSNIHWGPGQFDLISHHKRRI